MMRAFYRKLKERQDGSALVLVAGSLVLLIGMAAFGVDLGWFYLNSSQIQRAADASALAGVIHLPGDEPAAFGNAQSVAKQNGYDDALAGTTVTPFRLSANQLEVTIAHDVPTFFLKVFGFSKQTISKSASAEYIPPLKLGSPSNTFGNDPTCYASNPSVCAGNFWANIHGRNTDTRMGDAFGSYCFDGGGSTNGCSQNPFYQRASTNPANYGYLYGITAPVGATFSLETLDMTFHNELGPVTNDDWWRTGDHNNFCSGATCTGPTVTVRVYAPDPTPLDVSDNGAPLTGCNDSFAPQPQFGPDSDPPFVPSSSWVWNSVCSVPVTSSGIYVVQIQNTSSNINTSGLNRYSLRVTGDPNAKLFALRDFSVYNNSTATVSRFPLAEVPDYYSGKTFVVELYDPGDSNAGGDVQLRDPNGNIWPSCEMSIRSGDDVAQGVNQPWTSVGTLTPCTFTALNNGGSFDYNGDWVQLKAKLDGYSCTTDCWWEIWYDFVGGVNDTTTWRAYMIGNPIHLIP